MIHKDYIEQQIELLVKFIAKLINYKRNNNLELIETAITEYSIKNGFNLSIMTMMTIESILNLIIEMDDIKKYTTGVLLKELAINQLKQGKVIDSKNHFEKSLCIFTSINDETLKLKSAVEIKNILTDQKFKNQNKFLENRVNSFLKTSG
jgi:hypothetical protein